MTGEQLSPEEIQALLNSNAINNNALGKMEKDAIVEVMSIAIGSSSNKLTKLIGKEVSISAPHLTVGPKEEGIKLLQHAKATIQAFTAPLVAKTGLVFAKPKLDNGESVTEPTMEWMTIFNDTMVQTLSTMLNAEVSITLEAALEEVNEAVLFNSQNSNTYLFAAYDLQIADEKTQSIIQILPIQFARALVEPLLSEVPAQNFQNRDEVAVSSDHNDNSYSPSGTKQPAPSVKPIQFSEFGDNQFSQGENRNLNMLMDIPLKVTVELGRTKKLVKDILELSQGSIIELDKIAGEPVDILVNNKPIAQGEVVVIDENFGVRITEILSTSDRLSKLT